MNSYDFDFLQTHTDYFTNDEDVDIKEARSPCCIYKTNDGYCTLHSDGIDFREPCVEGPCDDEEFE